MLHLFDVASRGMSLGRPLDEATNPAVHLLQRLVLSQLLQLWGLCKVAGVDSVSKQQCGYAACSR